MSEIKHTPGPWTAIHDPAHDVGDCLDNGGYRIDADGVEQLAFVWALNHRYQGRGIPQSEGPAFGAVQAGANARLIIAAPDLLEAAELLEKAEASRDGCEECEGEGEPEACGMCFPAFDDARIKRRLAIAKAEGKR